jgi:CBS domain-containing protein
MTNPDRERIERLIAELERICLGDDLTERDFAAVQAAIAQLRADHPAGAVQRPAPDDEWVASFWKVVCENNRKLEALMAEYRIERGDPPLADHPAQGWHVPGISEIEHWKARAARLEKEVSRLSGVVTAPDVHVAVSPEAVDEVITQMPPSVAPAQTEPVGDADTRLLIDKLTALIPWAEDHSSDVASAIALAASLIARQARELAEARKQRVGVDRVARIPFGPPEDED